MENKEIDNCCEYSGIYLEGRCGHSCHSKAPEIHGYMGGKGETKTATLAPTDESWEEKFLKDAAEIDALSLVPLISSLLKKTIEENDIYWKDAQKVILEKGKEAGKSEAFRMIRNSIAVLPLRASDADMVEDALSTLEGK